MAIMADEVEVLYRWKALSNLVFYNPVVLSNKIASMDLHGSPEELIKRLG
jgi:hypothetical protein